MSAAKEAAYKAGQIDAGMDANESLIRRYAKPELMTDGKIDLNKVISEYWDTGLSPIDYRDAMLAYYNAGKSGESIESITDRLTVQLNTDASQAAYAAGLSESGGATKVIETVHESRLNQLTMSIRDGKIKDELFRRSDPIKRFSKALGKQRLMQLTIPARKRGMDVVICEFGDELYWHLVSENATASSIGNFVIFRPDATVSEVLEEMRHFEQNLEGMNSEKPYGLRTILNEIDAREYILANASKYSVPSVEIEDIEKSLKKYQEALQYYERDHVEYEN